MNLSTQRPVLFLLLAGSGQGLLSGRQREQDLSWVEELLVSNRERRINVKMEFSPFMGLKFVFAAQCRTEASEENVLWQKWAVCRMAGLSALLSLTQPVFGLEGSHVVYEL